MRMSSTKNRTVIIPTRVAAFETFGHTGGGHFEGDNVTILIAGADGAFGPGGFGVGGWTAKGKGRLYTGGPAIPGPRAYLFGLVGVIDNEGGTGAEWEARKAAGRLFDLNDGDELEIAGSIFELRLDGRRYPELRFVRQLDEAHRTEPRTINGIEHSAAIINGDSVCSCGWRADRYPRTTDEHRTRVEYHLVVERENARHAQADELVTAARNLLAAVHGSLVSSRNGRRGRKHRAVKIEETLWRIADAAGILRTAMILETGKIEHVAGVDELTGRGCRITSPVPCGLNEYSRWSDRPAARFVDDYGLRRVGRGVDR